MGSTRKQKRESVARDVRRLSEEFSASIAAGQFDKVLEVVDGCLPMDASGEFVAKAEKSDVVCDLWRTWPWR